MSKKGKYHVVCRYSGERGVSENFYQAEDGSYYRDEDSYRRHIANKKAKAYLLDYISIKYLDYCKGRKFNTYLPKKLKEYEKYYSMSVVLETFKMKEADIDRMCKEKRFSSDYYKLKYIFAIIDNAIDEVQRRYDILEERFQRLKEADDNKIKKKVEYGDVFVFNRDDEVLERKVRDITHFLVDND